MTTLQHVELGVLGPLQVRQYGLPVAIPGAKPRAVLTMLGLHGGSVVSAETLVELLWGDDPPRTAAKALQTHISSLRRVLGDGFVMTQGMGWTLSTSDIDASAYKLAAKLAREAFASGDVSQAVTRFDEALTLWRGIPELPDGARGVSEKTRWIEGHAALVEERADALLATGRAAEIIGELEAAIADAPLRERRWGHLMLALYRAGRQGDALGAYQRARSLLAEELGVDPGPDLRRLEAAIVAQDDALEIPVSQQFSSVMRAVTFLLTDIEGSTAAWEADADAMAAALARHDEIVEQVVTSRGGRLIKTRGEGDATFSVFDRPSAAAAAAIELQEAIRHEPWALAEPMRIRVALHTGEVELRDGDYFGRAVNRAARLRSLAAGGQILCSGATAELVIDTLADDVVLADLGMRQLKNLPRPEHVFELRLETADDSATPAIDEPIERPSLPAVLAGPGPFVGRGHELERLLAAYQLTLDGGTGAVLIAGEPGVGKTRLAGEWSRQAFEQGAVVLYGRCDEDLGAPYQPFAEALRSLVPCLGANRVRGLRGVEALLPLVPGLTDALPDLAAPPRADPDTERYALFDAVVALLGIASTSAPVVLILDDLHWAAKPTLLLLRHLLRFGEHARVQILGTYRSTDLDRSHPLAAMLADLHRDGSAHRLQLSGLDEDDVSAYVAEAGYDDEELARALASVTGGNPFFLIEALRHVDESGGRWDPSTLPQGVREAVSRRLSRLPAETNKALATAAVVGSRFELALVESVVGEDLIDAFDEASKAGIVIEEPGGRYRFNHAIVRQSLLAELASVRRMRLHQRIAVTLETEPADEELLAELAYHYFECAWAGNAAKAVEYCRRAADQAMARLAYEGAADLYDKALHALEEIDDELPDRDDQQAELLVARCEALLAAGDVVSAKGAVSQLQQAASVSARLAAWGTCFDGQLSMLTDPERLDEIESALSAAAEKLAGLEDAAGEAKAHTVRAGCLARLGRIGDAETALDQALTAARRAREHRRVNNVLANAPLAALWGPNPVPRAGGRCLDVIRLLRITTGSPIVEATSTRCQGVLDAFRGRAAAGRALIDSARRTLTELGMRHALLEVDQFAGLVELVADDPAAAEPHLRRAYNGFRRMGLDADTAETAALLARACLVLDRDTEADELCTESEHLAGHALKASIAWRTVRAELSARRGSHDEARRMAEEAVAVAGRTDLLVDHGDACLTLATVLRTAGDAAGARAAAERAAELYELKGAAALAEKARAILGVEVPTAPVPSETPSVELDNACTRVIDHVVAALNREDWSEVEQLCAIDIEVESRRQFIKFTRDDLFSGEWTQNVRRLSRLPGDVHYRHGVVAVRGERLALIRLELRTADVSHGAPQSEMLQLVGLDQSSRVALLVWFDVEDMDAALAELDAAHARLEERPPRAPVENAASRAGDQLNTLFAENSWEEISALFADDIRLDDRRLGLRRESNDRANAMAEVRLIAELGTKNIMTDTLAIRGEHLVLSRARFSGRGRRPDAFHTELLRIVEIAADERIVAVIDLDPDDLDAAFEELDSRYLAGEAAPFAQVWRMVMDGRRAMNRHEPLPATWGQVAYVDHRRVPFAPEEFGRAVTELWTLVPDARYEATAVHALDAHGTVINFVIEGTDTHGSELQWPRTLLIFFGDGETRMDVFEVDDVDAALGRFDELSRPARQLENAASRAVERYLAHFPARDWGVMSEMLADEFWADDRRRVVNTGVRSGRDAEIANMQAIAELGCANISSTPIATRGARLVLAHHFFNFRDVTVGESIDVIEIDADNQIVALITFDTDDLDTAFTELDSRYVAGEAAAHAHTWSVISRAFAAVNRHELPELTPDWVNIDHRRAIAVAPGGMTAYMQAMWDDSPDSRIYIEAVHRLNDLGAVVTQAGRGVSHHGFDAEWRMVNLLTVDGNLINRIELYEEANLDAALAKFDGLSRPAPRLENAATKVEERFQACFAARDWAAMGEILADDISADDRRRVVNAGIRHGRDAKVADMRATADLGTKNGTSTVIAIRGQRLALVRIRLSGRDQRPDAFHTEMLGIAEIDADNRMTARLLFDVDDIDAAFEELDTRYLAGEAAPHAHTWSVIAKVYAAFNRRERSATTAEWVNVDHRRGAAFAPGEMSAYLQAAWDDSPDTKIYIAAVHRLSNLGGVVTHVAHGISQEGFDAEWRDILVLTVEGESVSRSELFDESDLDAALTTFDELARPTRQLENTASRVTGRFYAYFAVRDWAAMTDMVADGFYGTDRRLVVSADLDGRDAVIESFRAAADLGLPGATSIAIATRGERLVLTRVKYSLSDQDPDAFHVDLLFVVEVDAEDRIATFVAFDLGDIDAAFAELDAQYLAGEGAPHAHTWSLVAGAYAALNRREVPATTQDWVNIDHQQVTTVAPGDFIANIRASWDVTPDLEIYIEAVHRLSDLGAVVTHAGQGTSRQGFDAEWRMIVLLTVAGDLINGCEIFDAADIDAALATFDRLSRPAPRLENAASQVWQHLNAYFSSGDWAAMSQAVAPNMIDDDRRRTVNGGVRRGRDIQIANGQAVAETGADKMTSTVIAIRGERLALCRSSFFVRDQQPGTFRIEFLSIIEIDVDGQVVAHVGFDLDDIGAAFEELDARYLAVETASHAHTWSVIAQGYAAANRGELAATAPDVVNIDNRRLAMIESGELIPYLRDTFDELATITTYPEAVHRLTDVGVVLTHVGAGTSKEGFDAEWRMINVVLIDGDLISRSEMFDEADIDAAIARFDQLTLSAPRLENAASQVAERYWTHFADRNWDALAEILTDEFWSDDRRRMVGAGVRHGRNAEIEDLRAISNLGLTNVTSTIIATRGERLILGRVLFSGPDHRPESALTEILGVIEIAADQRIRATIVFDPDALDAAFEELDARYLAGEAAPYSDTWSVVAEASAAVNRHEIPPTTPRWVNIDHRRGTAFAPGDAIANIRAWWDLTPEAKAYIEAVHRLSNLGAVVSYSASGTSQDGFDAEWRLIELLTVEGDLFNRCEIFDETDLDAAVARFDELSRPAPRLENAASQAYERFKACFAARDWGVLAEILADDVYSEDRRRVVNAGQQQGRDAVIAELSGLVEVVTTVTSEAIASRGSRLVLSRARAEGYEAFLTDVLDVIEVDADGRVIKRVVFDPEDIDAAFEELETRYLAGEAAAHASTWSVIARGLAAFNRRELPGFTPDSVNVDHRRARGFAPGDLTAYIGATWDLAPDVSAYAEAVHRLSNLAAVWTHAVRGTSQDGFDAEWREICLATVEGDLISRIEMFDEEDIDAALAKFDELTQTEPQLENAASQMDERFWAYFAARDWPGTAAILADDVCTDDRRRVVNAGLRQGRDAVIAEVMALAEVGLKNVTPDVVATRGERLVLSRVRLSVRDQGAGEFYPEVFAVVEIDTDNRMLARVVFDLEDIEAAVEDLDARYLAGEAAANAHTWSLVAGTYAAINRHELPPTTPGWVNIDHRRLTAFAPGDMAPYIRATWDVAPDIRIFIEAVHRLSDLGAVVSHVVRGSSQEGFEAEWRETVTMTVAGDQFNRSELFDEADLDDALARFDELTRPAPQLENQASRIVQRYQARFAARDWDAMAVLLADDISTEDRRRVVNAGFRQGRDAEIASVRAIADVGTETITSTVLATRGDRLVLARTSFSVRDWPQGAFDNEIVDIVEIDADNQVSAHIVFDPDDFNAAIEELDARYLAGEAAEHAHTWSVIARGFDAVNRREIPATTPDFVDIDHRQVAGIGSGDLRAYLSAAFDDLADNQLYVESVHRLTGLGAVVTHVAKGTSLDGLDVEWRLIDVVTNDGDLINRCELFDEADLDSALGRFDELTRPAPQLENAASRVDDRFEIAFAARDFDVMAGMLTDEVCIDDRRRVVNAGVRRGRDVQIASMRATADLGVREVTSSTIATRGERLALSRNRFVGRDRRPEAFHTEALCIIEIDTDERILARVTFDSDQIDAAIEELDARYLAGEAAAHEHTWSLIARNYAAFNRHEFPSEPPGWMTIDHRRGISFEPGELTAYIHSMWDTAPDTSTYIETVHRVSDLGAVFTQVSKGSSQQGFEAEWREICLLTADGETFSGCELFDEADLDAALARFDELDQPTPRLVNAASQVAERFVACFAARDWTAMAELLAEDMSTDDHRPVVGTGLLHGRDTHIASMRAVADVGTTNLASTVIATRGERLVLSRLRFSGRDQRPEAFYTEALGVAEINADNRIVAQVSFEADDIDAAFAELDARYLAGEAAAHAHTWSLVAGAYAALNRREIPATTPDWVSIDHRRVTAFAPGDQIAYFRATWDVAPNIGIYIEAVHRLSDLGAVVTHRVHATTQDGSEAEWRENAVTTVEGDLFDRSELFDETDLDAALARFDELSRPTPCLESPASRVAERFLVHFEARDWDAMTDLFADDYSLDDRRRIVNSGVRHGSDAAIEDIRAAADVGLWGTLTLAVMATRGERLVLTCLRASGHDPDAIQLDVLPVIEIDADERFAACIAFDPDDIDSAMKELDARYAAGEAGAHAHTWSLIARNYAAFNRHEFPSAAPDWVTIDHRRGTSFKPGDLTAYIRATWDIAPDTSTYIESVHRVNDVGAVLTQVSKGTSQQGFEAEWREICLLTADGETFSGCELFDETDLDVALARFDELTRPTRRLENAASRIYDSFNAYLAARDWEAMAQMIADNGCNDDRRRVVSGGILHGRDAQMANLRAVVEVGGKNFESTVIATRGERVALTRSRVSGGGRPAEAFALEMLTVIEIDADNRISAGVNLDLNDLEAAFEELDARYLAGEAAAHSHMWSLITRASAAFNRHVMPPTTPDWVNIDHRKVTAFAPGDMTAYMRATFDVAPDIKFYVEAVHRLTDVGVVFTQPGRGIAHEGFEAEWRDVVLMTIEGDQFNRCELFDEADLDAALARFDELSRPS